MKMELKYRETLLATSEKYINLAGSILDRTIALNKKIYHFRQYSRKFKIC